MARNQPGRHRERATNRFSNELASCEQGGGAVNIVVHAVGARHDDGREAIKRVDRLCGREFAPLGETLLLPVVIQQKEVLDTCNNADMKLIDSAP